MEYDDGFLSERYHSPQATGIVPSWLPTVLLMIFIIVLSTRAWTGFRASLRKDERLAPKAPHWVPGFGHALEFALFNGSFLRNLRHYHPQGAFEIQLFGRKHVIAYSTPIIEGVVLRDDDAVRSNYLSSLIRRNIFKMSPKLAAKKSEDAGESFESVMQALQRSDEIANVMSKAFERTLPDLVSFMPTLIDQHPWERLTTVTPFEGSPPTVETSLYPLIQSYLTHITATALLGAEFLENNPSLPADLHTMAAALPLLLTGLPRWIPLPRLTTAHIARHRLLTSLDTFHVALANHLSETPQAPNSGYRDLSDTSSYITTLTTTLLKEDSASVQDLASTTLQILLVLTTRLSLLSFWLLMHILSSASSASTPLSPTSTPSLLKTILTETPPHARASQPKTSFAIAPPPRLALDLPALSDNCPTLKSGLIECVRLYSRSWEAREVLHPFAVLTGDPEAKTMVLRKGEVVAVSHWLAHTDPGVWGEGKEGAAVWRCERHVKSKALPSKTSGKDKSTSEKSSSPKQKAEWTTVMFGGDEDDDPGLLALVEQTSAAFVAGFLALWEVAPAKGGKWRVPRAREGGFGVVALPVGEVGVTVRRRELGGD
ncbi:hypothetical protein K402DRAFT_454673 [Aulographum hederae CBS 113979]|uniref:Cytochrome P450 n=1 Tax=Aulographum hederae CBS 113979 TaxID=1176131 RepID=A0A6G1GYF3_9PEZI|nr:hypothetical protein K402DRAFT_454673 [Aulographum hederae CBS 113979]